MNHPLKPFVIALERRSWRLWLTVGCFACAASLRGDVPGRVAVRGWTSQSETLAVDLLKGLAEQHKTMLAAVAMKSGAGKLHGDVPEGAKVN